MKKNVLSDAQVLTPEQVSAIVEKVQAGGNGKGNDDSISTTEVASLAQTVASISQELAEARTNLAQIQGENQALKDNAERLGEQVQTLTQEAAEAAQLRTQVEELTTENERLTQETLEMGAKIKANEHVSAVRTKFFSLKTKAAELRRSQGLTPAKFNEFFGADEAATDALIVQHIKGEAKTTLENLEFYLNQLTPNSLYPEISRENLTLQPRPGETAPTGEDALVQSAVDSIIDENYGGRVERK